MPMILLAVVGSSNQSNTITMMSLLWWGALTNQNHAQPTEDYHRSLPLKITVGVHHRRSPWEFTTEDHRRSCGRSPWELTVEDHHGRSLREFTTEDYCGRSPWKFTMEDHLGSLLQKITVGVYHRRLPWEFTPITLTIGCP